MNETQKIILVTTGVSGTQGLASITKCLNEGWRIAQIAPMGGAGGHAENARFAALVVVERTAEAAAQVLEEIEERAQTDIEDEIERALEGGFTIESAPKEQGWRNPDLG